MTYYRPAELVVPDEVIRRIKSERPRVRRAFGLPSRHVVLRQERAERERQAVERWRRTGIYIDSSELGPATLRWKKRRHPPGA